VLMERFEGECKPLVCEQPGQDLGIKRKPDPTHVVWMHELSITSVQPFAGWDHVFACVMEGGLVGLREGNVIVLTPVHWSAQQWGRS
jgi:hypothetical protein